MPSNATSFTRELRSALSDLKAAGSAAVSIDALESYLNQADAAAVQRHPSNLRQPAYITPKEQFEYEQRIWEVTAPLKNAESIEMFKSVIEAGSSALKAAMITNGGAAIALLAFMGNAVAKGSDSLPSLNIAAISQAMLIFFVGVWLAAFAYGARYLTQAFFYQGWNRCAKSIQALSIVFGSVSFCLFLWGGFVAHGGFG